MLEFWVFLIFLHSYAKFFLVLVRSSLIKIPDLSSRSFALPFNRLRRAVLLINLMIISRPGVVRARAPVLLTTASLFGLSRPILCARSMSSSPTFDPTRFAKSRTIFDTSSVSPLDSGIPDIRRQERLEFVPYRHTWSSNPSCRSAIGCMTL